MSSSQELQELIKLENNAKQMALKHLSAALTFDQKFFNFELINNGNAVKISIPGDDENFLLCNVTGDNIPAMLYDVLKQGRRWLF